MRNCFSDRAYVQPVELAVAWGCVQTFKNAYEDQQDVAENLRMDLLDTLPADQKVGVQSLAEEGMELEPDVE